MSDRHVARECPYTHRPIRIQKRELSAYIHAPTGIRTYDLYSSGRETRANRTAAAICRDNYLIISLIGFDEAEVLPKGSCKIYP